jgi:hypothetical protein
MTTLLRLDIHAAITPWHYRTPLFVETRAQVQSDARRSSQADLRRASLLRRGRRWPNLRALGQVGAPQPNTDCCTESRYLGT